MGCDGSCCDYKFAFQVVRSLLGRHPQTLVVASQFDDVVRHVVLPAPATPPPSDRAGTGRTKQRHQRETARRGPPRAPHDTASVFPALRCGLSGGCCFCKHVSRRGCRRVEQTFPTTACKWETSCWETEGGLLPNADQKTRDLFSQQQERQRKLEQARGLLDEQPAKLQMTDAEKAAKTHQRKNILQPQPQNLERVFFEYLSNRVEGLGTVF